MIGLYYLGLALFWMAVAADLSSTLLWVLAIKRGHGPSGIPVVPWVIYFLWIMVFRDLLAVPSRPSGLSLYNLRDLGLATAFHLLCQYAIPLAYCRWVKRRKDESSAFR